VRHEDTIILIFVNRSLASFKESAVRVIDSSCHGSSSSSSSNSSSAEETRINGGLIEK